MPSWCATASLVAIADLAAAGAHADLNHRGCGGQLVTRHLPLAGVQHQVPARETADSSSDIIIGWTSLP